MDKKELINRYDVLYNKMAHSNEPRNMMIFGESEKTMFHNIAESHTDLAQKWLNKLEAIEWKNYLCEGEATDISDNIVNQDGSKGFHWDYNAFKTAVETNGFHLELSPYYNKYSLWVMTNVVYSDHANSIAKDMGFSKASEVPSDKMFISCYDKAVEKLTDADRPYFIRKYFEDYI